VELLVVIGIITILISMLLPALSKVRRQAQGTQCLSNLRVLSQAAVMFTNDNNGWMPARANNGSNNENYYNAYTKYIQKSGSASYYNSVNWIAFEYYADPYGSTVAGQDENLTYSGLAKYLNITYTTSQAKGATAPTFDTAPPGGFPDSLAINAQYAKYFRCPGDEPAQRPGVDPTNKQPFRYSYQLNDFVCSPAQGLGGASVTNGQSQRVDFLFNGKLTSINNPSNIILFVCADEYTIGWTGEWSPNPAGWALPLAGNPPIPQTNLISARHSSQSSSRSIANPNAPNLDGYGNVSFCDGHAALIGRKESLRQVHTGSAAADPVGF
jgi:prepilin-type processing-associated H-X9-DG protein